MATWTVWVVSPVGYRHSGVFFEIALALRDGLRELGERCEVVDSSYLCRGRTIVLGAHLLANFNLRDLPRDMIVFNFEQLSEGGALVNLDYHRLLLGQLGKGAGNNKIEVWDYCRSNIEYLKRAGIEAKLCEIGYMPSLTKIPKREEDIDVLHMGSMNSRRAGILDELKRQGVKVEHIFGVYGKERDGFISRAKIVLNIHYYESKVFEIVRCSYLMANRKCVVSEYGKDSGLEALFYPGMAFCDVENISEVVSELLSDGKKREQTAEMGFEIFSSVSQAEFLKGLI